MRIQIILVMDIMNILNRILFYVYEKIEYENLVEYKIKS